MNNATAILGYLVAWRPQSIKAIEILQSTAYETNVLYGTLLANGHSVQKENLIRIHNLPFSRSCVMVLNPMLSSAVISFPHETVPSWRISHFNSMDSQSCTESVYVLPIDSITDGFKPSSKASFFHFVATACITLTSFGPGMTRLNSSDIEGRFPIEKDYVSNYSKIITVRQ